MAWKIGDTVELNSGGPDMTVIEVGYSQEGVKCAWFDNGTVKEGIFPGAALTQVNRRGL